MTGLTSIISSGAAAALSLLLDGSPEDARRFRCLGICVISFRERRLTGSLRSWPVAFAADFGVAIGATPHPASKELMSRPIRRAEVSVYTQVSASATPSPKATFAISLRTSVPTTESASESRNRETA